MTRVVSGKVTGGEKGNPLKSCVNLHGAHLFLIPSSSIPAVWNLKVPAPAS